MILCVLLCMYPIIIRPAVVVVVVGIICFKAPSKYKVRRQCIHAVVVTTALFHYSATFHGGALK